MGSGSEVVLMSDVERWLVLGPALAATGTVGSERHSCCVGGVRGGVGSAGRRVPSGASSAGGRGTQALCPAPCRVMRQAHRRSP